MYNIPLLIVVYFVNWVIYNSRTAYLVELKLLWICRAPIRFSTDRLISVVFVWFRIVFKSYHLQRILLPCEALCCVSNLIKVIRTRLASELPANLVHHQTVPNKVFLITIQAEYMLSMKAHRSFIGFIDTVFWHKLVFILAQAKEKEAMSILGACTSQLRPKQRSAENHSLDTGLCYSL